MSAANTTTTEKTLPKVLPLIEDDEFEEFAVEDWQEEDTYEALLSQTSTAGNKKTGLDSLWEENWDDDDVADDFSSQLRAEIAKVTQSAMQKQ